MRKRASFGFGAALVMLTFSLLSPALAQASNAKAAKKVEAATHPPTPTHPDHASSPLLGSWDVDVTRLPMPPEAPPQRVTIRYSVVDAARWQMDVEIVDNKGSKTHGVSVFPLDGTQVAAAGSPEADKIAAVLPQPDVLVTSLAKGTSPASTRIYAVADDGKTMVETASYFGAEGKSILRTNYFTRSKTP